MSRIVDLVERDVAARDPARPDLARPVVERQAATSRSYSHAAAVEPGSGLVTHEVRPVALEEPLVGAGAHEQDVARLDPHPLALLGCRQIGRR